jgi:hypothetical protein
MTPKELDDLCAVCKANRVHIFTDGQVKLVFHLPEDERPHAQTNGATKPTKPGPGYSDFLFAATEGFPDTDDEAGS